MGNFFVVYSFIICYTFLEKVSGYLEAKDFFLAV